MDGYEQFLDFAYANNETKEKIYCPCKECCNRFLKSREKVKGHLILNGFLNHYKNWIYHGESNTPSNCYKDNEERHKSFHDDMVGMVHDAFGIPNIDDAETGNSSESTQVFGPNEETKSLFNLIKDAEQPLYLGCEKFTQLSFIVRMLSLKVMSGWTDKSFTLLLELLIEAFPEGVRLPNSYYKANKMTTYLDFTYKTWDTCHNHCMLFKDENKDIGECVICHASRYKEDDSNDPNTSKNTIANKNGENELQLNK
ncbi:hypothetical protein Scep_002109 [Stephania cephalantha]|uniref:Transposase-associated domain-containing protein n=1 Tax=Stephania cephalantha TaxID=152367 RepID=A0AAP0L9F3_9MAGN